MLLNLEVRVLEGLEVITDKSILFKLSNLKDYFLKLITERIRHVMNKRCSDEQKQFNDLSNIPR